MDHFSEYSIPILGLKDGEYQFTYTLDRSFFNRFEDAPISDGVFEVQVDLDKRNSMLLFSMQLEGTLPTTCDMCTASINLPLQNELELIVKHSDTPNDDGEVVFILPSSSQFNLAKYLYEFAILSLPIVHRYDCQLDEIKPCNTEVLHKIEDIEDKDDENPVWDVLKGLQ